LPFPSIKSGVLFSVADAADPIDVKRRVCGGLAVEGLSIGLPGSDDVVVDGVGDG